MSDNEQHSTVVWQAPVLEKPVFKLYYDDRGYVIAYTCGLIEDQNYIVIDAQTYAESRPDVRVVNGRLVKENKGAVIAKLFPSTNGVRCEREDISVITTEDDGQYWELKVKEL